MRIIAQTNKEWICVECERFLYVLDRTNDELTLTCNNEGCTNVNIAIEVKLQREYIDAKVVK